MFSKDDMITLKELHGHLLGQGEPIDGTCGIVHPWLRGGAQQYTHRTVRVYLNEEEVPKEHDTRGESTFITVASLDSKYHQVVIKMYEIFEKKCNKKVRHGLDFMMQDGSNANVYDQVAHQDYDRPFLNALLHVDGPGAFY